MFDLNIKHNNKIYNKHVINNNIYIGVDNKGCDIELKNNNWFAVLVKIAINNKDIITKEKFTTNNKTKMYLLYSHSTLKLSDIKLKSKGVIRAAIYVENPNNSFCRIISSNQTKTYILNDESYLKSFKPTSGNFITYDIYNNQYNTYEHVCFPADNTTWISYPYQEVHNNGDIVDKYFYDATLQTVIDINYMPWNKLKNILANTYSQFEEGDENQEAA